MRKNEIKFKVEKEDVLSEILKEKLSKKFYRFLKSSNATILVDNEHIAWFNRVKINSEIKIIFEIKTKEVKWPKVDKNPRIVYENDNYLIVDKEPDLLTIPTKANPNSLYQQLVNYLGEQDIHILNRLDKETSGLVVVAKNRYAASLLEPTHMHMVRKYLCLVEGQVLNDGTIINHIKKCEDSNKRIVSDKGQIAISHYKVLEIYEDKTLLEFVLETGRTHQIRVHTSNMGHPIIGDTFYGGKANDRLCLTSYDVSFYDSFINERLHIQIERDW